MKIMAVFYWLKSSLLCCYVLFLFLVCMKKRMNTFCQAVSEKLQVAKLRKVYNEITAKLECECKINAFKNNSETLLFLCHLQELCYFALFIHLCFLLFVCVSFLSI